MKLLLIFLAGLCATKGQDVSDSVRKANSKFADRFSESVLAAYNNQVFSPFSAHAALSMLYQGAGGTTKEALAAALQLPEPAETAQAYDIVLNNLNSDNENINVKVANKVYVTPGHTLKPEFSDALKNYFHSDVQSLNFGQNAEAAKQINTWVEDNTDNKIHDLLQADDLSVDTHIVLVNALYVKGSWLYPFDKQYTKNADFFVDADTTVQVPMMSTSGRFIYGRDEKFGAEVVVLPFKNLNYTFFVVVPIEKYGVNDVLRKIIAGEGDFLNDATMTDVDLKLPKFSLSKTTDMEEVLGKMGLSELFDSGRCDLTNMFTNSEDIYVSKAVQKTYIDVNEFGCEAASASGTVETERLLHRQVRVDHPFLFIIYHHNKNEKADMLLVGRIVNPNNNEV